MYATCSTHEYYTLRELMRSKMAYRVSSCSNSIIHIQLHCKLYALKGQEEAISPNCYCFHFKEHVEGFVMLLTKAT